jgi:hypothetical protein
MATRVRSKRGGDDEPSRNDEPRRNNSNRGAEPSRNNREAPKRGVARNKSLPMGVMKRRPSLERFEDATKQRRPQRRAAPESRGIAPTKSLPQGAQRPAASRNQSGPAEPVRKGRKAPAARGINASSSMGADQVRSRGKQVLADRGRGSGSGTASGTGRARSTSRPRPDQQRARSRSADASAKALRAQKPRRNASEPVEAVPATPPLKGRRAPARRGVANAKSDVATNPALASPVSGRKAKRAPERRGVAPSKSLPSEQIRRVEKTRREAGNARKVEPAQSGVPPEPSSSEESSSEESSAEESSSESSMEPTETSYGPDLDSDLDSETSVDDVLNNQDDDVINNGYEDSCYFGDDDDQPVPPAPKIGGRVVYPGGIVVEDASDSEAEFEHQVSSRNRHPDQEGGEMPIEPITFGKAAEGSKRATGQSKSSKNDDGKQSSSAARRARKASKSGVERQDSRSASSADSTASSTRSTERTPVKRSPSDRNRNRERERRRQPSPQKVSSEQNRPPDARRSNSTERFHDDDRRSDRDRGSGRGSSSRRPVVARQRSTSAEGLIRKPVRRSVSAERIKVSKPSSSSKRPGVKRSNSAEKMFAYMGDKAKSAADKARNLHRGDDHKSSDKQKPSKSERGSRTTDDGVRVTPTKPASERIRVKQAHSVQAKPPRRTTGEHRPRNGSGGY